MKAPRGEVWSVDFQPTRGVEISKIRPAVVMNDSATDTFQAKSCSETRFIAKLGVITNAQEQEIATAIALMVGFECP